MPQLSRPVLIAIGVVVLLIGVWWFLPNTVQGPSSQIEFEYEVEVMGRPSSDATTPLLIALHGNGDTPSDFFESLLAGSGGTARVLLIRAPLPYPGGRFGGTAWPNTPDEVVRYGDALADAIGVLVQRYPAAGKPLVTGFSGGAEMAYYLASMHGRDFSYILPVAGRLRYQGGTGRTDASHAMVIAFHASGDEVIPYKSGTEAAQQLTRRGVRLDWRALEGGHLSVFQEGKPVYVERLRWALQRARIGG